MTKHIELTKERARGHPLYGIIGWPILLSLFLVFVAWYSVSSPQEYFSYYFALLFGIIFVLVVIAKKSDVQRFCSFVLLPSYLLPLFLSNEGSEERTYSYLVLIFYFCPVWIYFLLSDRVRVTFQNKVKDNDPYLAGVISTLQSEKEQISDIVEQNIPQNIVRKSKRALKILGHGSGFFVTSDGYAITNNHVIEQAKEVRIAGKGVMAEIVVSEPENDLALLKFDLDGCSSIPFRDGWNLRIGEEILAAGYPLHGLLSTDLKVTTGVVNSLSGPGNDRRIIQISTPVQKGNSGGPILDYYGNIAGVVTLKLDAMHLANITGDIPQNVNFAISDFILRSFLDGNDISYLSSSKSEKLDTADVAEIASGSTFCLEVLG
jgi:S1-C subfamily serine protease